MVVRRWIVGSILALSAILVARPTAAGGPYQFYPITPCRLVDTRGPVGLNGGPAILSGWNGVRNFQITQLCGVPMTAQAAALNLAMITPSGEGYIAVWPYNTAWNGNTSNINAPAGIFAIANGCVVGLTTGSLNLSAIYGSGNPNVDTTHLVIDVTGYYQ